MRILHVIGGIDLRAGGPTHAVRAMVGAQVRAGHDVSLLTTTFQNSADWLPEELFVQRMMADPAFDGAEVRLCRAYGRHWPWSSYLYSPACDQWLRRRLSNPSGRPDLVHMHGAFGHVIQAATRHARRYRVPYLLRPAGCLGVRALRAGHRRLKDLYVRLVLWPGLRDAGGLHATSPREADDLARLVDRRRIHVVPMGVDVPPPESAAARERLLGRFPRLKHRRIVLFLSRITAKKRPELLVEAVAALRPQYPDLLLVLAGEADAHEGAVRAALRRHRLEDAAVWTGFLDGADKQAAFAAATVFALPSLDENFGVAVVEAMAHGVAVLVTPEVASWVYVEASRGGAVVEGTLEGVTEGLRALLTSDDPKQGERARQYVQDHLSWTAVSRQLESVYRKVA